MSIETHILVDGQYVPQRIPIHQILSEDRVDKRGFVPKQHWDEREHSPEVGLLSRTIVRSPAIKWIFPAKLRSSKLNDLIFVSEDHIQIVNILRDGHFNYVGGTADFGSKIRAACVFGKQSDDDDADNLTLPIIKSESPRSPEPHPALNGDRSAPPQTLVLSLASGELRFISSDVTTEGNGHPLFFQSCLAVPAQGSLFQQAGKHLAVDPFDRALAVASNHGTVILYKLKGREDIKHEIEADRENWTPVTEEIVLSVNATIIRMEFLYPSHNDSGQVILLLFGSNQSKHSQVFCYEWDHETPLRQYRTVLNGYKLEKSEICSTLIVKPDC